MRLLLRRVAASALILIVSVGGLGCCAAWAASADAEMGRRADGDACPMHQAPNPDDTTTALQATESCCPPVARADATPAVAPFAPMTVLAPAVGPASFVVPSTGHPRQAQQAPAFVPGSPVPKHLLLSVFLI